MIREMLKKIDAARLSKHAGKITLLALGLVVCLYFAFADKGSEAPVSEAESSFSESYAAEIEEKLKTLISRVDGVGECYVMVMLSDGGTDVYAVEEKVSESSGSSSQRETVYAVTKDQSSESPLKITEYPPSLSGIAVVCRGGGSASVKAEITELISSLTGLPSSCIHISRLG